MAGARRNGNGKIETLDAAMRELVHTQAALVQNQASFQSQMTELNRVNAERFARIEAILLDHSRVLAEHSRILHALPEAVREKIGFRPS